MIYAAIDTETTGFKHATGDVAFCLSYTDRSGKAQVRYLGEDMSEVLQMSKDPEVQFVGHNIGFDLPFLHDLGVEAHAPYHDTMIAAHVYNNLEPAKDLSSLAKKYCNIDNPEELALDEWFACNGYNKDNRKYNMVPESVMRPYSEADARMTLALFKFYKSKGVIENPAYITEMRCVRPIAEIVARGMAVDIEYAKAELDKATTTLADLERQALAQGLVNIASTQQLADILFTRDGLVCTTHTEKGNICLDESAMQQYSHPLIDIVLQHRELSKLAKTYLVAILEKSKDGRLYSSIKQVGARTGRMSAADPNLQNIPRPDEGAPINLRKAFVCTPCHDLLLIDLSQIELRILAHYAKEEKMIEVLTDREGDIHAGTAIAMFEELTKELRTIAKTVNFCIVYGGGPNAVMEQVNKALRGKKTITLAQAKDFRQKYFKGYPAVQQFIWDVQKRIMDTGYVFGKSGRRYHCEKDRAYVASNYLIQGESAMLLKQMITNIRSVLKPYNTRLVNVIHDEMIFDLHHAEHRLIPLLHSTIERPGEWRVPIYANVDISNTNWAEKRKFIAPTLLS